MVTATAAVSALALLAIAPAHALLLKDGGGGSAAATTVGNPGDSAWIARERADGPQTVGNPGDSASVTPVQVERPSAAPSGADGSFDAALLAAIAGGVVLALGAGALVFTVRHRRMALP
jgi:hypothetical protein